jgi:hypothetical protein
VYATIIAVAMAGLCLALLGQNLGTQRAREQTRGVQLAFYAAEAGLSDGYMRVSAGLVTVPEEGSAWIGTPDAPVELGSSSYWVEIAQPDLNSRSIVATGVDGRERERLELLLRKAPTGFFQFAAFGADGVLLDSNAFIDSYDSRAGTYESQVQGGNDYALQNGNVGSNADIVMRANTTVHGDVRPGPEGTLNDSAPNTYVSGSTDPADELFEVTPIDVPVIASSGTLVGTSSVTLGPGPVHYDSILMQGGTTLTVNGPATFVVDSFEMLSNSDLVFDTTGGPIELYATGDFVLQSNSTLTTFSNSALDLTLLLSGNNRTGGNVLQLGANAEFIGAIYAPNSRLRLASNFDIFGSVMCGFLDLSSFGEIHFDEALLYDGWGATDEFEVGLWRRLPRQ